MGWLDWIQCGISERCKVSLTFFNRRRKNIVFVVVVFSSSPIAALALVNTNAAAASALLTWVVLDAIRGQITISGACVGPLAGLVAVTPACGFIQPGWALLFGIIPAFIIYFLLLFKHRMKFDDTLDVALLHGCGEFSLKNIFKKRNSAPFIRWSYRSIYDWIIL